MISETDKAYIAGLFDGEGCVGYYKRGAHKGVPYHSASVIISMTDPRPIQWLQKKLGYGKISFSTKSGNRRNVYSWQLSSQETISMFLSMIRPYLLLKGDQVDILLNLWMDEAQLNGSHGSVTPEVVGRREEVLQLMKTLKGRGVEGVETRRAESALAD